MRRSSHSRKSSSEVELRITENPSEMWYKDVGGKRSHLTCVMELVGNIPKSQEYDLNADLYYESSKRLAEEWQWILHFLMTDNKKGLPVLSRENPRAEVHFRIEKVSTSFMNQRFKVHFVATPRNKSGKKEPHLEVYTTPIESKAKPKRTTAKKRVLKLKNPTVRNVKRRKMGDNEELLNETTRALMETQKKLENTESMLVSVVFQLERCIDRLDRLEKKTGGRTGDSTSDSEDGTPVHDDDLSYFPPSSNTRFRSASERLMNITAREVSSLKRMGSLNRCTSTEWFDEFDNTDSEIRAQKLITGV